VTSEINETFLVYFRGALLVLVSSRASAMGHAVGHLILGD